MNEFSYLNEIIIILLAYFGIVIVFKHLELNSVLGYLVAGALIGSHGFGILKNEEHIKSIAEFGIVFLLFSIGLELSFEKLKALYNVSIAFLERDIRITKINIQL